MHAPAGPQHTAKQRPKYTGPKDGPNCPLALAHMWCGWGAVVFGKVGSFISPPEDMLAEPVQREFGNEVLSADVIG